MLENKDLLDRVLIALHPPFKITRPDLLLLWAQKDRLLYKKTATRIWAVFMIVYVGHFFFVDIPLQKTPLILWAGYRFGLGYFAALNLYLLNSKKNYFRNFYRLPSLITALIFSYFQAQSMIWRVEVPYPYAIIIAVCGILSLNASAGLSLACLVLAYLSQLSAWLSRPNEFPYILSAASVGMIFTAVMRARLSMDVDVFLAERSQLEAQKNLIENQREMNEHIQAFLPRKIYRTFLNLVKKKKLPVTVAMDEVLRPRQSLVSCLYTDIRGFTQIIKKNDLITVETVLKSQRTFTDIVQDYDGIPRITGDLVFAIYENELNPVKTISQSFECALELIEKQAELNSSIHNPEAIKRYVLISFGPAIIGNVGGVDGSRDVAAIGDCANILSRIDQITKLKGLKEEITSHSILLTPEAAELLLMAYPNILHKRLVLRDFGTSLKDFPEVGELFLFDARNVDRRTLSSPELSNRLQTFLAERYQNATSIPPEDERKVA